MEDLATLITFVCMLVSYGVGYVLGFAKGKNNE